MEGWLWKRGAARALSVGGTSKRRWFKLQVLVTPTSAGSTEKRLALTYFKSPDHARAGAKKLLGHVDLSTATEVDVADAAALASDKLAHCRHLGFRIVTPLRTWFLVPEDEANLVQWIEKLHQVLPVGVLSTALLQHARERAGSSGMTVDADKSADMEEKSTSDGVDTQPSVPEPAAPADSPPLPVAAPSAVGGDATVAGPRRSAPEDAALVESLRSELAECQRQVAGAWVTIAQLRREKRELQDRLEMRDLDAQQVMGLGEPLLANFGLGSKGQRRKQESLSLNQHRRKGTDPDEGWDDDEGCCQSCTVQ